MIRRFMDKDVQRLRSLAGKVAEISQKNSEHEKATLWCKHNDLQTGQPLIFCDPENGWHEIITQEMLLCTDELARNWEFRLLKKIFSAEVMNDDVVTDADFSMSDIFSDDGWGLKIEHIGEGGNNAYHVKQVLEDYDTDFAKIHFPRIRVDEAATERNLEIAHSVFDGLLNVKRYTMWWWSMGLTCNYIDLRGLEDFMCDLIVEPEWVHRMMELLCQGTLDRLDMLQQAGRLYQNNGNHYVGSGGFGFTDELPMVSPGSVTTMDMWGFTESQETVSVSPDMFGEFIFPYHKRIADRFGLNCCCCCEPFEGRWSYLKQLPRLRRVSCSPWSKRSAMPELLGKDYISSIKLNPAPLARPVMNEDLVRAELREALENSVGCVPELIMKDCHTLGGNPNNAVRWVQIAREEIDRISGM